jgi:DNA polymerase
MHPNTLHEAGRIKVVYEPKLLSGTLLVFLPSGRPLMYPDASIETVEKFGRHEETVVFRHPTYGLVDTYGGKMAENVTQAAAADLLRELLVRMRDVGVLHTHDELIIEVPEDEVEEGCRRLREEMLRAPEWAEGLPLACEVEHGARYKIGKEWTPGS